MRLLFSDDGGPGATSYAVYHFGAGAVFVDERVVEVVASGFEDVSITLDECLR